MMSGLILNFQGSQKVTKGEKGLVLYLNILITGNMSSRRTRPEIRVKCVQFSPTGMYSVVSATPLINHIPVGSGRAWAAVTTEGLLIYSLDSGVTFDPFDLSEDITPDNIELALNNAHYSNAVMMSFKLNEKQLITRSLEAVPPTDSKTFK